MTAPLIFWISIAIGFTAGGFVVRRTLSPRRRRAPGRSAPTRRPGAH